MCLVACTETGDFGRPRPSVWNTTLLPKAGDFLASQREEPVSNFTFTDDEHELRNRAWRFIMPAHPRQWFDRQLTELVRTRILPLKYEPFHLAGYYEALRADKARSPASRFRRLSEDMVADQKLIPPFSTIANRVIAADRVRLKGLVYLRDVSEDQIKQAASRVAENRCLIAWVRLEWRERLTSYRYALEHLMLETPQLEAVEAERILKDFETGFVAMDQLIVGSGTSQMCDDDGLLNVLNKKPEPKPSLQLLPKGGQVTVTKG